MPSATMPAFQLTPEERAREGQECIWVIEGALDRGKVFPVRASEFIAATRKRFEQFKERTMVSPRELNWLRDLRKKCRK
jgi:hypothetical protein